jgi:hypothetical protein
MMPGGGPAAGRRRRAVGTASAAVPGALAAALALAALLATTFAIAALAAALAAVAPASSAWAAEPPVSITVSPAEVTLTPHDSATVALLLANAASSAATVRVQAVPADSSVRVSPAEVSQPLAAGGSVAITVAVSRISEGSGKDVPVRFVLTETQPAARAASPQATIGMLTVKAAPSPVLLTATIQSNVLAINENRPGEAVLVISNPREDPVTITGISVTAPDSVDVSLSCPDGTTISTPSGTTSSSPGCVPTIAARQQQLVRVGLRTTEVLAPGPRSVVVRVTATDPRTTATASAVATAAFQVEVYGESDILKSVGVPIFLLLPGLLVVVCAGWLIGRCSPWRRPRDAGGAAGRSGSSGLVQVATATAVLGLAISLVIAVGYPVLTTHLVPGQQRNYLKAYGFLDFYLVFGYAFALAVAVWLLSFLGAVGRAGCRWLWCPPQWTARRICCGRWASGVRSVAAPGFREWPWLVAAGWTLATALAARLLSCQSWASPSSSRTATTWRPQWTNW